jgi:hypothetical protein
MYKKRSFFTQFYLNEDHILWSFHSSCCFMSSFHIKYHFFWSTLIFIDLRSTFVIQILFFVIYAHFFWDTLTLNDIAHLFLIDWILRD